MADTVTFRPVSLISAVQCSTFSGVDVQGVAAGSLDVTADYALAREMLTGEAARRDANRNVQGTPGNPSLQSVAMSLGDSFVDPVATLGCLEQALADATGGRRGVILIGPEIAMWLSDALKLNAGQLTTITGTRVIIDGGFDGRAPGDDSPGSPGDCIPWNTTGAPVMGDQLWMYATSAVWAGVGSTMMLGDIDRANNTATARDERPALAAFTPCATFAAGSGITKAC